MPSDDLEQRLKRAEQIAAVVALYETPELKIAVYRDLMDGVASRSQSSTPLPQTADVKATPEAAPDVANKPSTASERFAKFSHESGVPAAELERVFYFSEDGLPHLNGPRARLGRNSADQAKAVAVAITAAYDYVRDETPISDDVVKAEAMRLKIDLGGNWARTMGDVAGVSWTGAARQKQFKTSSSAMPDALRKVVTTALGAPAAE